MKNEAIAHLPDRQGQTNAIKKRDTVQTHICHLLRG